MSDFRKLNQAQASVKWGTSIASIGLMICLIGDSTLGGVLLLLGLGVSVFGLHQLGRSGAVGSQS